ncbi:sulfatase-like hydrolase/transferase [Luteolibacter sp.]|uniref:sulfatase-like hydrolase/transferase n=1 Tax=Luteolibacter sp. TaxID=1962973 RepID=UPI003264F7D8
MKLLFSVITALAALAALAAFGSPLSAQTVPAKPNVLFIVIDDLRDWVGYLGHNPQALTPNIDRLAARGVIFTRSYCASPSCNPSRASLMSGMRPGATGVYNNNDDWRQFIAPELTLNMHFRANGYEALGSGKIYHEGFDRYQDWDDYLVDDGSNPAVPSGQSDGVGGIKFAPLDCKDEELEDWRIVNYTIDQLGKSHDKPLFLACGIHKPHLPWNVPRKYYDMHPLDQIVLPPHLAPGVDLSDVPPFGRKMALAIPDQAQIVKAGRWKDAVQGCLAAISYTDMLVGRLLDALDQSPMKDNTIICFWSDHGWNLGEKDHWRKFALWEETTRSPLLWVVPGVTSPGTVCERTVDLMSVYPTLCDLCGIDTPAHVQGTSIRTLLQTPAAPWDTPAVSTYTLNCHAVRDEGWRYIRYRNGDEELYDETADPNEWNNLAKDPAMTARKAGMAQFLPTENYIPAIRKIVVEQPLGIAIQNAGNRKFRDVKIGGHDDLQFMVKNRSNEKLTGLAISIQGSGEANFKVIATKLPSVLDPGGEAVFTVRFAPLTTFPTTAKLRVDYTGGEKSPYRIKLMGATGDVSPEIVVSQPIGSDLKDGKSRTNFGTVKLGEGGVSKLFRIKNTGTDDLRKITILVDGDNRHDFTAGSPEKTTLTPGAATTFSVKFKPSALGNKKAAMHIKSNDVDENPFDVDLVGTGAKP